MKNPQVMAQSMWAPGLPVDILHKGTHVALEGKAQTRGQQILGLRWPLPRTVLGHGRLYLAAGQPQGLGALEEAVLVRPVGAGKVSPSSTPASASASPPLPQTP